MKRIDPDIFIIGGALAFLAAFVVGASVLANGNGFIAFLLVAVLLLALIAIAAVRSRKLPPVPRDDY